MLRFALKTLMKIASAIVTNRGGRTCHAAIVSRELGIPCVVGTDTATKVLKDAGMITVDGKSGMVYEGNVVPKEAPKAEGAPAATAAAPILTSTNLYVILAEPDLAELRVKPPDQCLETFHL